MIGDTHPGGTLGSRSVASATVGWHAQPAIPSPKLPQFVRRVLLTGFPGFLATGLLPRLIRDRPDTHVVCLVEKRMRSLAEERLAQIGVDGGRVTLVDGDITVPGLGLSTEEERGPIHEVFHLAAIYEVGVDLETAERVNVNGTRNVLDFCQNREGFERLHYVSTCYVSGRYDGVFREEDLEAGHGFNNHYERTKHRAEVEVRSRMDKGLPTTVYRPAAVVGDSRTGITEKFDGLYFVILFLLRQPRWVLMPVVGDLDSFRVNIAPRDYIVDAISYLSLQDSTLGGTFHLADPEPPTNGWLLRRISAYLGKRLFVVRLPAGLATGMIRHVPGVQRWLGMPAEAVGYFTHPTTYDTRHTVEALSGGGVVCPPMNSYIERLVDYAKSAASTRSAS